MNYRLLTGLLPIAVFYSLSRVGPSWLSIAGGFTASAIIFWYNRQHRFISGIAVFGFVIVAASAGVGIIIESEKAYLASGPVADFLFVPLHLGSAALRRPILGGIARELFPAYAGRIPPDHSLFMKLSIAFAAHDLLQGTFRVFLLNELSVGQYLVLSRIIWWPVTASLIGLSCLLIYREAHRRAREEGHALPSWNAFGRVS